MLNFRKKMEIINSLKLKIKFNKIKSRNLNNNNKMKTARTIRALQVIQVARRLPIRLLNNRIQGQEKRSPQETEQNV